MAERDGHLKKEFKRENASMSAESQNYEAIRDSRC